jgi:ribosomal protein S12 methylthiotransferase accessory factor
MKFQHRIRFESGSTHRIERPEDTIRRIQPYMERIGVTRISDTTGLDTIGMPIFSAIRPTDADLAGISVYNGKGLTKADSKAGAMMEAIERYRAETWLGHVYRGTFREIERLHPEAHVMNPVAMRLQRRRPFDSSISLEWVDAWDLLEARPAMVAMNFVLCPYRGPGYGVFESSTNGLASGNCLEEAVVHALAEVIERDAYTIAMVRTELADRFDQLVEQVLTAENRSVSAVDATLFPCIDLDTMPPQVRGLVRKAERAGAQVMFRHITSDIGIPAFIAFLRSWNADDSEFVSGGFGCDPNSTIAAIRAITEAAQGRNVCIQGVREDAKAVRPLKSGGERNLWRGDGVVTVPFDRVPTYQNDDILGDLDLIIERLKVAGVREAYAIDLSDPQIPASVIRVVVPDMESWFLTDFAPDTCRLGSRASRYLGGHPAVRASDELAVAL